VRYVLLNPCRPWTCAGTRLRLVSDPLSWPWSTLRDVIGATAEPWIDAQRLQGALEWTPRDFARRFHGYVSSDPSVRIEGTPFPETALPCAVPAEPLAHIADAVLCATRLSRDALRVRGPARAMFVGLASRQGWTQPELLARACDAHRNTVTRLMHRSTEALVAPAALCLGDVRLTCSTMNDVKRTIQRHTSLVLA
jgi:hypothetical protein